MQCASCQHENAPDWRFCANCGAPLHSSCDACGASLSGQSVFCSQCGAAIDDMARSSGERRQLTVMFCDLAGYTELSQRVDPEDLGDLLASYQQTCVREAARLSGHVAQYLGDGVLVYFGFPHALEDAAERALRAALAIRRSLRELNETLQRENGQQIHARIGVHTGRVVVTEVGADSRRATLALGDTTNVAARLQALAEPDGICVSGATLRLVPGIFRTRDLGTPRLKGITEPIEVHALDGFQVIGKRIRRGPTPAEIFGRDDELTTLLRLWRKAEAGSGQAVLVSGEPGIGKSRLALALGERLGQTPHLAVDLACSPYTAGSAFQPVVELLEHGLGFKEDDEPTARLAKLENRLGAIADLPLPEVVPYLALLFELPESKRFPLEPTGPELRRDRTLEALLAPFSALARQQPLLVVCEDLHWADPSTLELLGRLIDAIPRTPMLLAMTSRTGFESPWKASGCVHEMLLERLSSASTQALVRSTPGEGRSLSGEVVDLLADRADGVPLFAEQLARAVLESSSAAAAGATRRGRPPKIPSTLQDSLMARLDHLRFGKEIARVGAVLGRTFSYGLIESVAKVHPEALRRGLAELVEARILFESGEPPRSEYTFKHALLQDTAYESQLRSACRDLHRRVVETLEERFPQRVSAEPELIARHCESGGMIKEAVEYYREAGEQASAQVAYREAYDYFARALELLSTQTEDADRRTREIDLRVAQAAALGALRGFEDEELVSSIRRTDELIAAIGPGPQQIPGLLKLMVIHTNQLPRARDYANTLLNVVEPLGIAPLRMAAYIVRGTGSLTVATVPEACADLEQGLVLAEQAQLPAPRSTFEVDPLAMGYCTYAIALVLSGKPDTAGAFVERGLSRARQFEHVRTTASALQIGAMAFYLADEPVPTGELSEQCLELIEGRGFHQVEVSARVLSGWARVERGEHQALDVMDEALRAAEALGVVAGMPRLYVASAEAHLSAGNLARSLERVERAEYHIERSGEQNGYEPDVLLMRARILHAARELADSGRLLHRALELCERNQTPWMAVMAATLLGRLALDGGEPVDTARERLRRICDDFDEGFELARLRAARDTMDRLAHA